MFVSNYGDGVPRKLRVYTKISASNWQLVITDIQARYFDYSNNRLAVDSTFNQSSLYQRSGTSWQLIKTFDNGQAAAISGDTLVIAKPSSVGRLDTYEISIHERNFGGTDNWGISKELGRISAEQGTLRTIDLSGDNLVVVRTAGRRVVTSIAPGASNGLIFQRNQGGTNNWGVRGYLSSRDYGNPYRLFLPFMALLLV